ncbi:MAG: hypothetical protein QHI48_10710 [Bacteroidota bacterium]|nr:hypothetical protein [Bacteroidota bacterium]
MQVPINPVKTACVRTVVLGVACVLFLVAAPSLYAQRAPGFSFWQEPTEEPGGEDAVIHTMPNTLPVRDNEIVRSEPVTSSAVIERPFPSPFGPGSLSGSRNISFRVSLAEPSLVSIRIYTAVGQYLRTPVSAVYPAGRFDVVIDPGADLPSGVYVFAVSAGMSFHRFTVSYLR